MSVMWPWCGFVVMLDCHMPKMHVSAVSAHRLASILAGGVALFSGACSSNPGAVGGGAGGGGATGGTSLVVTIPSGGGAGGIAMGTTGNGGNGASTVPIPFPPSGFDPAIPATVGAYTTSSQPLAFDTDAGVPTNLNAGNGDNCGNVLFGVVRDFKRGDGGTDYPGGHPDFNTRWGSGQTGIVMNTLGDDGKPVYNVDSMKTLACKLNDQTTQAACTTGQSNFDQWYRDVPGTNMTFLAAFQFVPDSAGVVYTFDAPVNITSF